jgi:hypothetical protein
MGANGEEEGRSSYQNKVGLQTLQKQEQKEKEEKKMITTLSHTHYYYLSIFYFLK